MDNMVDCISENKVLKEMVTNCSLISDHKCMVDIRTVNITVDYSFIKSLEHFSLIEKENDESLKLGILTKTPSQVVFATLFKMYNESKNMAIEVFSTYNGVMNWLS